MVIAKIICNCGNSVRIRLGSREDRKAKLCWNCGTRIEMTKIGRNRPLAYVDGKKVERPRFIIEFQE
jgi:hypothetical protein